MAAPLNRHRSAPPRTIGGDTDHEMPNTHAIDECSSLLESSARPASRALDRHAVKLWTALPPVLPHVILLPIASRAMLPVPVNSGVLDSILSILSQTRSDAESASSSVSD